MTEISILQPTVLRGVIEQFTTPETLTMLRRVPRTPHPYPTVNWEVIAGSRNIATPNVPNSEAHIVPRQGRRSMSAAFVYLREKKVFEPTTIHWLRQVAASNDQLNRTNAEAAVLREIRDLNDRFDNFAEFLIWRALSGKIAFDYNDVQTEVDYKFNPDHKIDATTPWDSATPSSLVADIRRAKTLVEQNGRVQVTEAYASESAIDRIFDAYAQAGGSAPGAMLSDSMKESYYRTGSLPNFMGMNWQIENSVFDSTGSSYTGNPTTPAQETRFLDEDTVLFANLTANRPIELFEGPTADDEAPSGFTGKFAKTWKDRDPSARQALLEWNLLPVITRPDQIVSLNIG
jgi:hypothetical protein